MNKLQKIAVGIFIMSIPIINSCKKDEPASCNYATETQDELNAVSAAAVTYGNDPSTANCNAYKAAFQTYLNALNSHSSCVLDSQQTEYHNAIIQAQADLDALQC